MIIILSSGLLGLATITSQKKWEAQSSLTLMKISHLIGSLSQVLQPEAAKQVDLREYPLDQMDELHAQLAKYAGVSAKCVAAGGRL